MNMILGIFRDGKIELEGPPPAGWANGTKVSIPVELEPPAAAWLKWYDDLIAERPSEEAAEELDRILTERRQELKQQSASHNLRAEGLFP